tara:strand:- start:20 stop:226 length:207 start_codon:yes stop_codon:yes gene_type:complete
MKYITLPEMCEYLDASSIIYPITLELVLPMDSPMRMEFASMQDFNEWLVDTVGFIGTTGFNESLARIV